MKDASDINGWLIPLAMVLCGALLGILSVRREWTMRKSMTVMFAVAVVMALFLLWVKS